MTQRELNQVCRIISYGILADRSRTEIARLLNASGIKPPKAGSWTEKAISNYRYEHGLPTPRHERDWKKALEAACPDEMPVNFASASKEEQLHFAAWLKAESAKAKEEKPARADLYDLDRNEPKKNELQRDQPEELANNNATDTDAVLFVVEQIVQLKIPRERKRAAINALTSASA